MRQLMTARAVAAWCILCAGMAAVSGQQVDTATILQKVDAAVKARVDGIEGYTVTEHYAVFRNNDETHPVAEMTVKTTYKSETGKSYDILSQSGSSVMRSMVLNAILDNEKHVNEPGVREGAWITTANYQMQVKPGGIQKVDGHDCVALSLTPRRKEPYLLEGTLWADAKDGKIVRVEGKASKSSSVFTGPTQMTRQYADVEGFAQATHARAQSDSFLFGLTVVTIDYRDYQVQLRQQP
jgi:outer membrane lipoprotein-sorting protein